MHWIGHKNGTKFSVFILDASEFINVPDIDITSRKRTFLRSGKVAASQRDREMSTRVRKDFVQGMCKAFSQNAAVVKQFPELQNCSVAIAHAHGIVRNYCQDDRTGPHFENLEGQAVAVLHLGQDAARSSTAFYTDTASGFYRASAANLIWCAKHTNWRMYDTICSPSHSFFSAEKLAIFHSKSKKMTKGRFVEAQSFRARHGRIFLFPGDAFHSTVAERPELLNCNKNKGSIVVTVYFGNRLYPKLSTNNGLTLGSGLGRLDGSLSVTGSRRHLSTICWSGAEETCSENQYHVGCKCKDCPSCPIGFFRRFCDDLSEGTCEACPGGPLHTRLTGWSYWPDKCSNKACPAGQESFQTDRTFCDPCGPGKYKPDETPTACKECPKGRFATEKGKVCAPCAANMYSDLPSSTVLSRSFCMHCMFVAVETKLPCIFDVCRNVIIVQPAKLPTQPPPVALRVVKENTAPRAT